MYNFGRVYDRLSEEFGESGCDAVASCLNIACLFPDSFWGGLEDKILIQMFALSFSEHLDCLSNHFNYFGDGSLLNFIHFLLLSLSESDLNDLLDLVEYDVVP